MNSAIDDAPDCIRSLPIPTLVSIACATFRAAHRSDWTYLRARIGWLIANHVTPAQWREVMAFIDSRPREVGDAATH